MRSSRPIPTRSPAGVCVRLGSLAGLPKPLTGVDTGNQLTRKRGIDRQPGPADAGDLEVYQNERVYRAASKFYV